MSSATISNIFGLSAEGVGTASMPSPLHPAQEAASNARSNRFTVASFGGSLINGLPPIMDYSQSILKVTPHCRGGA